MNPTDRLKAIKPAYDKLLEKLILAEEQYEMVARQEPTSARAQAKLSRMAKEVDKLRLSVRLCEKLQDEALSGKDWSADE